MAGRHWAGYQGELSTPRTPGLFLHLQNVTPHMLCGSLAYNKFSTAAAALAPEHAAVCFMLHARTHNPTPCSRVAARWLCRRPRGAAAAGAKPYQLRRAAARAHRALAGCGGPQQSVSVSYLEFPCC